jgi:hypothetical protein
MDQQIFILLFTVRNSKKGKMQSMDPDNGDEDHIIVICTLRKHKKAHKI